MRHRVKPIFLVLDSIVMYAAALAVFVFIKSLNDIVRSAYYFYLLAYFVFNFLAIRIIT